MDARMPSRWENDDWRDLSVTRLSLVGRLRDWEDQVSWRRFLDTYGKLLFLWSLKAGLSDVEAEEAVQETVVSVAKAMKEGQFDRKGKGSFKAWLYGVARHRIADQFRKRSRGFADVAPLDERALPSDAELEAMWDAEWNEHRMKRAIELTRERVRPAQFQIFDLYVLRGWSVDKIRAELKVSRAQVYMAKLRVGSVLKSMLELANE